MKWQVNQIRYRGGYQMKMKKTILAMLAPTLVISTLLTACGDTAKEGSTTAKAEDLTPTDISIFTTFFGSEPPGEDNVIKKEIEKRSNTKLNISWISTEAEQKANVMLASGDIPDLMFISNINSAQFTSMVNQGAFWDVTPFLKDYPNLMKFPEDTWIYTRINGKNFGIPRVRPTEGGSFPYVRKDWLDKLGLKTPTNMDEVYTVLKAFVEKDPDGNGKADTVGMVGLASETSMNTLAWVENIFNKANGEYAMVDGKLINKNILPGTREALVWLNKAYNEKLIPQDFAVLKSAQASSMMKSNKGGMYYGPPEAAWPDVEDLRKLGIKEADTLPLISLNGVTFRDAGFFGMYAIPKTVPEAKLKKILKFMDYGASDEGSTLGNYGIKDTHYKDENGIKIATPQATKDVVSSQTFGQIYQSYDKYFRAYRVGMDAVTFERNKKIIDERAKVSIPDYGKGLYSVTDEKLGADYTKKLIALKVKIIMGKEQIGAWDTYIEQLKNDANFKKIETEINEAYKVRMGNK
jgi:putative aldouronate transport system substrate-binding protein